MPQNAGSYQLLQFITVTTEMPDTRLPDGVPGGGLVVVAWRRRKG